MFTVPNRVYLMKNGRIQIQTAKMENKPTNRAQKQDFSTYRVVYKASEATSRAT